MEVEKILAIQPYKHEHEQQKKEYSFNGNVVKRFISYLNDAEADAGTTRAEVMCFQACDSIMMQYDKMQNIGLRIRMKMEREE